MSRPLILALAAFAFVAMALVETASAQLAPWPAGPGTEIGQVGVAGGLPAGFEPSGVAWHPGRNTLLVVSDSGFIAELPPNGGLPTVWSLPGDLEGITIREPASPLVYVGVENPDSVVEFDLSTGLATGKSWNLTAWLASVDPNQGLEALAYVDGEMWAGLQADGMIFRFTFAAGGVVNFLGSFASYLGRTDLAGLDWDPCTGVVCALYDTANVIVEYDSSGVFLREYAAAGTDQEGVALMGGSPAATTPIFIAQDSGQLYRYETYPVAICPPGTWTDLGGSTAGSAGTPTLIGTGALQGGWPYTLDLSAAPPNALMFAMVSFSSNPIAILGGTLHTVPIAGLFLIPADAAGALHIEQTWPAGVSPGISVWFQLLVQDAGMLPNKLLSNGLRATTP